MYYSIAIPTRIREMHPEWDLCTPSTAGGLWDPPVTIHAGAQLVPTTSRSDPIVTTPVLPLPTSGLPLATSIVVASSEVSKVPVLTTSKNAGFGPLATTIPGPMPAIDPPDALPDIIISKFHSAASLRQPTPAQLEATLVDEPLAFLTSLAGPRHATSALILVVEGEAHTMNDVSNFVIDSQTLAPGGVVSIGATRITVMNDSPAHESPTILSLDSAVSFVVVNHISTITLKRPVATTALEESNDQTTAEVITMVLGGTTVTLPNGQLRVLGGTTIVISAQAATPVGNLFAIVTGGHTITLDDKRVIVFGGQTTMVAALPTDSGEVSVTLTIGGITATLPNGQISTIGGPTTVIHGAPGATIVLEGWTTTLPDGRVRVISGTTAILEAAARSTPITTELLGEGQDNGLVSTIASLAHQSISASSTEGQKGESRKLMVDWARLILLWSTMALLLVVR